MANFHCRLDRGCRSQGRHLTVKPRNRGPAERPAIEMKRTIGGPQMNPFSDNLGSQENKEAGAVMSDTMEADGAGTNNWYFIENGQRRGPVTTASLLELLQSEKISGDTLVLR